ncbi:unnamed protein product [Strongylus vulgaris]|uniref:Uncharacterized protein n=1 Tax=Strongylus vulgaris TaxID=40348 RepID=A0A3P7J8L6_STRVU|nr:unnamed protein product [Strongylus vulgaris]
MDAYPGVPKVAHAALKLGRMNLYRTDDDFEEFFRRNQNNFENSFLFFLGYQGPRSDGIKGVRLGRYENRNPFLIVALPRRLRGTLVHKELQYKSLQLMTLFDVHATFMDILYFQPKDNFKNISYLSTKPYSKGSSLLRKWKDSRNCNNLPIPWEYCLCQYERKNVKDKRLQQEIGKFIAKELNDNIKRAGFMLECRLQKYEQTLDAQQLQIGSGLTLYSMFVKLRPSSGKFTTLDAQQLQIGSGFTLYSMFVKLKPSNGKFTAEVLKTSSGFLLVSRISRWGHYNKEGNCAPESLRPFCQCWHK